MEETPPPSRGPRFGIGLLVLLTTVLAVAAAALGGLQRGGEDRAFFVIFTLIAPVLVLLLANLWQQWMRRK